MHVEQHGGVYEKLAVGRGRRRNNHPLNVCKLLLRIGDEGPVGTGVEAHVRAKRASGRHNVGQYIIMRSGVDIQGRMRNDEADGRCGAKGGNWGVRDCRCAVMCGCTVRCRCAVMCRLWLPTRGGRCAVLCPAR